MTDRFQLPDEDQRDLIRRELDRTMLVEAAAGTGKTTEMINRMVALLGAGKCRPAAMAAVTFTRKAAAELRSRFQIELEKTARKNDDPTRREILAAALGQVDQCFIGTIHSFCARLLRERPVEAGVDVGFEEIDDDGDRRLRQKAWDELVARAHAEDSPLIKDLDNLGLPIGSLGEGFERFCSYPDVSWPTPAADLPAPAPVRAALGKYLRHLETIVPGLPKDPGNDTLIPKYRRLLRLAGILDLNRTADLIRIMEEFGSATIILRNWPGGKEGGMGKAEEERWKEFCDRVAGPFNTAVQEARYPLVIKIFREALKGYDRLRREHGGLNYQDLLMKAAELLRNHSHRHLHVRSYFQRRFTHLLVDEFQDTDPIQAEVMMLLTSDDPSQTDWRRCRPREGSLFVVGDPKQSIYRFRRADIVTYNRVKKIIAENGGMIVSLSANFRSVKPVVDWVNEAFESRFPDRPSETQPEYVPLQPARIGEAKGDLMGVKVIETPRGFSNQDQVSDYESSQIANLIRGAVEDGMTVPHSEKELKFGAGRKAEWGDFMIVTWKKARLGTYSRALQNLDIPHQVTGGGSLNDVDELALLYRCLLALAQPENPVALVAVLRSELFGISDDELYRFKKAGGEFSFRAAVPENLDRETHKILSETFDRLKTYSGWLAILPPAAAVEEITADLGLFPRTCLGLGGNVKAGSLGKAIELLRAARTEIPTFNGLVDYLGQLVDREEHHDGLPARPPAKPVVRVMNLHQVKGLEAPVLFLADPSGGANHEPDLYVDRSGPNIKGYLRVTWCPDGYHPRTLAQPRGWDKWAETESKFDEAEKDRLLYVAATRAGSQLTISQRSDPKANQGKNPWAPFETNLIEADTVKQAGLRIPVKKTVRASSSGAEEAFEAIEDRWEAVIEPNYTVEAVKKVTVSPPPFTTPEGEHGTEWGTVIHALLENAMRTPMADRRPLAEALIAEHGLEYDLVDKALRTVAAVTQSDIWYRATACKRCLVEVPFQVMVEKEKPAVERGVIDLVFWEKDGWVIVDYKTDRCPEKELKGLIEKYRPQVQAYKDYWEKITSKPVKEIGLFFTYPETYRKIE